MNADTKMKEQGDIAFVDEVAAIPGGEGIRLCIQCGTCTASCPNADKMEHTPSQLIAMVRAGMRKEVLSSNAMWYLPILLPMHGALPERHQAD